MLTNDIRPRIREIVQLTLCGWLLAVGTGCDRSSPTSRDGETAEVKQVQPQREHFAIAMESLRQRDEHNLGREARQATYHLNCWIEDQPADKRWFADRRMLKTLPLETRTAPSFEEVVTDRSLALLEFVPSDIMFLEETRWLNAIARWVSQLPDDRAVIDWLPTTQLSGETADQLIVCYKLFDWVVRNVQLDELLPYPQKTTAGPAAGSDAQDPMQTWPPPMRAEPGPGYRYYPWHVLQYGHGDMLQRARVFILLCRQLEIEAVMLGIDTKSGRPTPWLPAVLLNGELYLFDTQLGIPIPASGGRGIATLAQVIANPQLLRDLDIGSNYKYPIEAKDLTEIVAMIDSTPEYLAQRMKVLESNLDADNRMVLTSSPTNTKRLLETCQGLKDIRLWAVPYETAMYQRSYQVLLERDPQERSDEFFRHGIFMGLTSVVKGRRKHLLGRFESDDDNTGATAYYIAARLPEVSLENFDSSAKARSGLGMRRRRDMNEFEWSRYLQSEKMLHVQAKQNASYWLGLVHLDKGNYDVASKWFLDRTLEAYPDGPWTNGARCNLARCQEALGNLAEARRLYQIDESPQRHGSLLRARRLEQETANGPPESNTSGDSDPEANDAPGE